MNDKLAVALAAVAISTICLAIIVIVAAMARPSTVKLRSACDVDQGRHHLKVLYYSEVQREQD